jgi:large subunit ribosomal protein L22e
LCHRSVHFLTFSQKSTRFVIDCTTPVSDAVFDIAEFEKYLVEHFKAGKGAIAGDIDGKVTITREKSKIVVISVDAFAKKYLKYLTRRYLKSVELRDIIRVLRKDAKAYHLTYYASLDEE